MPEPQDFDSPRAEPRIRAAETFLEAPTQALVDAFCRRWGSPTNLCEDTKYAPDVDDDARRLEAMAAYDRLNDAFRLAIGRLRKHDEGLRLAIAGFGTQGDRTRVVCLKGLDTPTLVARLSAHREAAAPQALAIAEALLASLPEEHAHRSALGELQAAWAPEPKTKKKKKKKTARAKKADPYAAILEDTGNLDEAGAKALRDDPPPKRKAKALAERLLSRADRSDPQGALRTLESAWRLAPAKGAGRPAPRAVSVALELACAEGDLEQVLAWLERADGSMAPSRRKDLYRSGILAPFALHHAVRERLAPKLPASTKAMHEVLDDHLLPTLTLRAGYALHAAQPRSAVGGIPYLPKDVDWPSAGGVPMLFLAQLDFAELPTLPGFPDAGMLLLFVPNDATLGMRFGAEASVYGAVFVDDPASAQVGGHFADQQRSYAEGHRKRALTDKPTSLAWTFDLQPPIPEDVRFEALPGADALKPKARQQLHAKFKNPPGFGGNHRLGGYAEFVQHEDPRRGDSAHFVHLLSLDSYDHWNLMFGDGGLAHFFIDPEDLAAKRFDRMLWFWDCA